MRAFALLLLSPLACVAAPPGLLIEAELAPSKVYVGAEALLKLRLLRAPGVAHGTLRPPALGGAAEVSLVGSIRTYVEKRDGLEYEVVERTHVIVPHQAGRLVVPGATWESSLGFEVYNKATGTVPKTALGPEKLLEVMPAPAEAAMPFLPARSLVLRESWSRDLDALSEGIPVTRTVTIRAEGLAAERLPRIEMSGSSALLVHHDQPELSTAYFDEGMVGQRVQRIVLMPVGAGDVTLPELSVKWWDVNANLARVTSLPGRGLVLHALLAPVAAVPSSGVSMPRLLQALIVAAALLTALALGWHVRTRAARAARRRLRDACRRNDAPAARDALLDWSGAAGARATLVQAIGALHGARAELAALDAALYAGHAWNGADFWRGVQRSLR